MLCESFFDGKTYRIQRPDDAHPTFVTINHWLNEKTQQYEPIELFIHANNPLDLELTAGMSQMVSNQLRLTDPLSVAQLLKDICDYKGGYIIPKSKGKKANSLTSHVGYLLEERINELIREKDLLVTVDSAEDKPLECTEEVV